ncbi:alpha/beta hydrolase [Rhodococcus sp. NPDC060090]|uniref:alpha/beta hydrolase n=1 Tax=Rhodococcus sp. NPDC060090 TaxID=3347056 RepID=UPI00365C10F5
MWFRRACGVVTVGLAAAVCVPAGGSADPVPGSSTVGERASELSHIEVEDDRTVIAHVYSASMDTVVPLRVRTPADTSEPRPTLYLLNGSGGGQGIATWDEQTDVGEFFADKNVNVVTPLGGRYSYYTDWEQDDPELGRNKWTTFLTEEVPSIIDEQFGTTGANAIAGLSMSGTSVLGLATAAPELYRAVGAYSGCAETSTPVGQAYVQAVVRVKGGDPENMWGPVGGPGWIENDPYLNAEKLRGVELYVSAATGLPGEHDQLSSRSINYDPLGLVGQIVVGGTIEAAVHHCTARLAERLEELEIPAHFEWRNGTHSWDYWEDDLHKSWPMMAAAIGL